MQSIAGTAVRRCDGSVAGRRRLVVDIGAERVQGRSTLLTHTVFEVVGFLAEAEAEDPAGSAVLDLRVPDIGDPALAAEAEAFIAAVTGLLQTWVLERREASCRANLVISELGQESSREIAIGYLEAEAGACSRGSSYDLRGGR